MRIIFAGTPQAAVPTLRAIIEAGHEVCAVITRPPAPVGRGRTMQPSEVALVAMELKLPVVTPENLREAQFAHWVESLDADAAVVVAYGAMIPKSLLDVPRFGWLNLHFSLLPAWRGAAPVQAAIAAGDSITGATVFRIDSGLDTGPVLAVMTESVQPSDTAGALLERLANGGAQLMRTALAGLASGEAAFVPQSADGVSRAPLINTDDARIQWQLPAAVIERLVRAYTPAPGAWTTFLGQRLRISETSISADGAEMAPGEIALVDGHVTVGTGSQGLILQTVTPAGKKPMSARSWWNGLRGDATRRFDSESDR